MVCRCDYHSAQRAAAAAAGPHPSKPHPGFPHPSVHPAARPPCCPIQASLTPLRTLLPGPLVASHSADFVCQSPLLPACGLDRAAVQQVGPCPRGAAGPAAGPAAIAVHGRLGRCPLIAAGQAAGQAGRCWAVRQEVSWAPLGRLGAGWTGWVLARQAGRKAWGLAGSRLQSPVGGGHTPLQHLLCITCSAVPPPLHHLSAPPPLHHLLCIVSSAPPPPLHIILCSLFMRSHPATARDARTLRLDLSLRHLSFVPCPRFRS